MKKITTFVVLLLCLTGCFTENYSTGHPISELQVGTSIYELQPIYVEWNTEGDDTSLRLKEEEITPARIAVQPNEMVQLLFSDTIAHEGEYTDIMIRVSVEQPENEQLLYESQLDSSFLQDKHVFQAPSEFGVYAVCVTFSSNGNEAGYVGELVVE